MEAIIEWLAAARSSKTRFDSSADAKLIAAEWLFSEPIIDKDVSPPWRANVLPVQVSETLAAPWAPNSKPIPEPAMTSRDTTSFLSLREGEAAITETRISDLLYRLAFGAIGWPWLLFSLWGGTKRSKRELMKRVALEEGSLPNLGSWKADTGFLHRIVDAVEELQPRVVVELGAGASSLVCAKALACNGGGRLISFDQHRGFVDATADWIDSEGGVAELRWAPLTAQVQDWPGRWYELDYLPDQIDLLIIDGPPWAVHPFVRGAAESLFDRLTPGGIVLLDDASRPGERIVARRWRKRWPEIVFERVSGSTKGTLVGRKVREDQILAVRPAPANDNFKYRLRRAAVLAIFFATGWFTSEMTDDFVPAAQAASIVDEAHDAYSASLTRHLMLSQAESVNFDRKELMTATGLELPSLPEGWTLLDVQLYPSDLGNSLMISLTTDAGEPLSLFAAKAETPAGELPLMHMRNGIAVAYWEEGTMALAVIGEIEPSRLLEAAAILAATPASPDN